MKERLTIWIFQTGEPLPSDIGSPRPMRAMNLTNSLIEAGHKVVLLSSSFDHQKKVHRYRKFKSINYSDSLVIKLIPSPGYRKNISLARLIDHLVLALNLKKFLRKERTRPDVVFIGYPPIESAYVMTNWLSKQLIPCLLDVKDQWPTFMVENLPRGIKSFGPILFSPYFFLAKKTMKEATGISAMADDFLNWALDFSGRLSSRADITAPLTTINNTVTDEEFNNATRWWSELGIVNNGKMKILFVGSHYPSLDFSPIFEAAKIINEKNIDCDFIICGHGELTEELINKSNDYKNIFFPGWVDQPKIEVLANMCSASISPFRNIDCFVKSLPNKVIDSLSLGLPILSPLKGEVSRLIELEKVGLVYSEKSGKSLFNCINKLISNPNLCSELSLNAVNLYKDKFSYEIIYGGLVKHLEEVSHYNNEADK